MITKTIIETIGALAKEEKLICLSENIMPNTLVLETSEPFPGYHGDVPTETPPVSVFLGTIKKYSTVRILRTANYIAKYFDCSFDADPGVICIGNNLYYCLRIRGLENYNLVGKLQENFHEEGIRFAKSKNINATAIIKIKKHFILERLEDGVYKDQEDDSMYYISIPKQVNWQVFAKITGSIKNNIDNANFDAALAVIYTKDMLDVVRIYAKEISVDRLRLIKLKYAEEILK
jgi:hypothetical protein